MQPPTHCYMKIVLVLMQLLLQQKGKYEKLVVKIIIYSEGTRTNTYTQHIITRSFSVTFPSIVLVVINRYRPKNSRFQIFLEGIVWLNRNVTRFGKNRGNWSLQCTLRCKQQAACNMHHFFSPEKAQEKLSAKNGTEGQEIQWIQLPALT